MDDKIKEIAETFLSEENISVKNALQLATLGLTKSVGDIAELTYGVNYSQHPFSTDRKSQLADYLGYALLNWHILALASGYSGEEIGNRFAAEWLTKHLGKASIKDLLKHLKPTAKQQETPTQEQKVDREPAPVGFTKQV